MNVVAYEIVWFLYNVLFYWILAEVILSWLLAFDIIRHDNRYVKKVWFTLRSATDPLCKPFQKYIGNIGGVDFSRFALLVILGFAMIAVRQWLLG
jgi:YggT family protein